VTLKGVWSGVAPSFSHRAARSWRELRGVEPGIEGARLLEDVLEEPLGHAGLMTMWRQYCDTDDDGMRGEKLIAAGLLVLYG